MQNLPGQDYFPAAGVVFSSSTRVKERFSLKSQNQPREIARRNKVIHQGHVRNMG
jgi:hypothetical protein